MYTRIASTDDALEVRRILDAAMLEPGDVEGRIQANDVFVAGDRWPATRSESLESTQISRGESAKTDERILGTVVLERLEGAVDGAHVSAIGVRRKHRGRGIGRALVEAALEREGRLTARFDAGVRPFYEALEFSIESIDDERYRGSLDGPR